MLGHCLTSWVVGLGGGLIVLGSSVGFRLRTRGTYRSYRHTPTHPHTNNSHTMRAVLTPEKFRLDASAAVHIRGRPTANRMKLKDARSAGPRAMGADNER